MANSGGSWDNAKKYIEAGKDLFLPATIRQKLAKCLKLNPNDIKKYERIMLDAFDGVTDRFIEDTKKYVELRFKSSQNSVFKSFIKLFSNIFIASLNLSANSNVS